MTFNESLVCLVSGSSTWVIFLSICCMLSCPTNWVIVQAGPKCNSYAQKSSESCILQLQLGECAVEYLFHAFAKDQMRRQVLDDPKSHLNSLYELNPKIVSASLSSAVSAELEDWKGKSLRKWIPICSTESNFTEQYIKSDLSGALRRLGTGLTTNLYVENI